MGYHLDGVWGMGYGVWGMGYGVWGITWMWYLLLRGRGGLYTGSGFLALEPSPPPPFGVSLGSTEPGKGFPSLSTGAGSGFPSLSTAAARLLFSAPLLESGVPCKGRTCSRSQHMQPDVTGGISKYDGQNTGLMLVQQAHMQGKLRHVSFIF